MTLVEVFSVFVPPLKNPADDGDDWVDVDVVSNSLDDGIATSCSFRKVHESCA
jgi:hypothetical protein